MALRATEAARIDVPRPDDFPIDDSDRQAEYLPANDLTDLARQLIGTCPELAHLHTATINVVWKREGGKSGGKVMLGKCTALNGYARYLSEADFLIWLAADHALGMALDQRQLETLLFHQLCHAEIDEESAKPKTRHHDFEGFEAEVQRYGLWTSELREAGEAIRQAPLPLTVVAFGAKP